MRRLIVAALCGFFVVACATSATIHPTAEHSVAGCYITCPFGWSFEDHRFHQCRGDRTWYLDIPITGEDNDPQNPHGDLWITGLWSYQAEQTVKERMTAAGVTNQQDPRYLPLYRKTVEEVKRQLGRDAQAEYPKDDVVTESCDAYRISHCAQLASTDHPCAAHPGEPDPNSAGSLTPP